MEARVVLSSDIQLLTTVAQPVSRPSIVLLRKVEEMLAFKPNLLSLL